MISWFLGLLPAITNWAKVIIAVIITAAICFALHTIDIAYLKSQNQSKLLEQQADLVKTCQENQQITTEVSHDYEAKLSALSNELSALQLRANRECAVRITNGPTGHSGAATQPGPAGANEVDRRKLYDFAAEAEKYRLQLLSCQDFINKTTQKDQKQ